MSSSVLQNNVSFLTVPLLTDFHKNTMEEVMDLAQVYYPFLYSTSSNRASTSRAWLKIYSVLDDNNVYEPQQVFTQNILQAFQAM